MPTMAKMKLAGLAAHLGELVVQLVQQAVLVARLEGWVARLEAQEVKVER